MRNLFISLVLIFTVTALAISQTTKGTFIAKGQGVVRRAAAGGGGSTTVVYDTFTAADDVNYLSRSGETGATWTSYSGDSNAYIESNRLTAALEQGRAYASGTPASADYDIQMALLVASDSTSFYRYARLRWDTASDNGYRCGYKGNGQKWIIEHFTSGGSFTEIGSYSQVLSTSTTYVCRCRIQGTAIKLDVDSVERISITDATWSAAGKAGLDWDNVQFLTTGYHVDYFWVGPNGGTVGP